MYRGVAAWAALAPVRGAFSPSACLEQLSFSRHPGARTTGAAGAQGIAGTPGHQDTRAAGVARHKDTRTTGYWDTRTLG